MWILCYYIKQHITFFSRLDALEADYTDSNNQISQLETGLLNDIDAKKAELDAKLAELINGTVFDAIESDVNAGMNASC